MTERERLARIDTIIECMKALTVDMDNLTAQAEQLARQRIIVDREIDQLLDEAKSLGLHR